MPLIILFLSLFLISFPVEVSAQATDQAIEREQNLDETLTITLYGNKYIVTIFVLSDTTHTWNNIHPYIPNEILKLDNPTLTPKELKMRLFQMKKPTMNAYQFKMNALEQLIAKKSPQLTDSALKLQISEFFTSNRKDELIRLFPEFEKEIIDADKHEKELAAFMFLEEIVEFNKKLLDNIKKNEAEKARKERLDKIRKEAEE